MREPNDPSHLSKPVHGVVLAMLTFGQQTWWLSARPSHTTCLACCLSAHVRNDRGGRFAQSRASLAEQFTWPCRQVIRQVLNQCARARARSSRQILSATSDSIRTKLGQPQIWSELATVHSLVLSSYLVGRVWSSAMGLVSQARGGHIYWWSDLKPTKLEPNMSPCRLFMGSDMGLGSKTQPA